MAFFDAVDKKSGHRMFISGTHIGDFGQTYGQDQGMSHVDIVEAHAPTQQSAEVVQSARLDVVDVPPHSRFVGNVLVTEYLRSQS